MAKKNGVPGWHSMRKEQLVKALLKLARRKEREKNSKKPTRTLSKSKAKSKPSDSVVARRIRQDREKKENQKNLSYVTSAMQNNTPPENDRLVMIVRDPFWVQAYWEITKISVQRAKIALTNFWHTAKPVLRLLEITSDGNTNSVEQVVQEVEIHSGVSNWYLQLPAQGKVYRMAIGYSVPGYKFHLICKSNQINSPSATADLDDHWTDITNEAEKFYTLSGGHDPTAVSGELQAVFEEKSRQPMHAPAFERYGSGQGCHQRALSFQVDAHMVVYGETDPNASVTVGGEPVRLQSDGSFVLKMDLPDRRQVLPVVASSRDGTQQRTTVLAVERNTKVMEPVVNDLD